MKSVLALLCVMHRRQKAMQLELESFEPTKEHFHLNHLNRLAS